MKSWHIVCCGVIALAASGCRSNDNYEPLYTEMRWLEDRIYDLQDHLDQAESELDACHRENLRLRQRLADAGVGEGLAPPLPPRTSPLPPPPSEPPPSAFLALASDCTSDCNDWDSVISSLPGESFDAFGLSVLLSLLVD